VALSGLMGSIPPRPFVSLISDPEGSCYKTNSCISDVEGGRLFPKIEVENNTKALRVPFRNEEKRLKRRS